MRHIRQVTSLEHDNSDFAHSSIIMLSKQISIPSTGLEPKFLSDLIKLISSCFQSSVSILLKQCQKNMIPMLSMAYEVEIIPFIQLSFSLEGNACWMQYDHDKSQAYISDRQFNILSSMDDIPAIYKSLFLSHSNADSSDITFDSIYGLEEVGRDPKINGGLCVAGISLQSHELVIFHCNTDNSELCVDFISHVIKRVIEIHISSLDEDVLGALEIYIRSKDDVARSALLKCGFSVIEELVLVSFQNIAQLQSHGNSSSLAAKSTAERVSAAASVPTILFVLAGQSNMSGRGQLQDLKPFHEHSKATNRVIYMDDDGRVLRDRHRDSMYFDPKFGWRTIGDDPLLHYNVDILKQDKVGLGLGTAFACKITDLLDNAQSEMQSSVKPQGIGKSIAPVVGLIPAAVGSTSLCEWLPDYLPQECYEGSVNTSLYSDLSSSSSSSFSSSSASVKFKPSQMYHPGCPNLLSCALRSIYLALRSASPARVEGILWYQGCNDASTAEDEAKNYGDVFRIFLNYLRSSIRCIEEHVIQKLDTVNGVESGVEQELRDSVTSKNTFELEDDNRCPIPMVSVAVTTSRTYFPSTALIRRQQLSAPQREAALAVVDAVGYALSLDCVHLTTPSLMDLGERMACIMWLLQASLRREINRLEQPMQLESQFKSSYGGDSKSVFEPSECILSKAGNDFLGYDLESARIKRELVLLSLLNSIQQLSEAKILSDSSLFNVRQSLDASRTTGAMQLPSALKSGLKAVNFVSGDINFTDFIRLLDRVVFWNWSKFIPIGTDRNSFQSGDAAKTATPGLSECSQSYGVTTTAQSEVPSLAFFDLGSGSGLALLAAAVSGYFESVTGIELKLTQAIESWSLLDSMNSVLGGGVSAVSAEGDTFRDIVKNYANKVTNQCVDKDISSEDNVLQEIIRTSAKHLRVIHGNFLDDSSLKLAGGIKTEDRRCVDRSGAWWLHADVVLITATVFADDVMLPLVRQLSDLRVGSRVVLLDKRLETFVVRPDGDVGVPFDSWDAFELVGTCQCRVSWGEAAVFVYERR